VVARLLQRMPFSKFGLRNLTANVVVAAAAVAVAVAVVMTVITVVAVTPVSETVVLDHVNVKESMPWVAQMRRYSC
jgi:hypothetical protein